MPAISPTKLRLQTARLAELYPQPGVFVRELHTLLMLYADNTHRSGQSGAPSALIEAYNISPQVMRHINLSLKPMVERDPTRTLDLCDALWAEPNLEHRLLACMLLGQMPITQPEPILLRLERWTDAVPEQRLWRTLIEHGMTRLRRESPQLVLMLVEEWLHSPKINFQQLGLRALIPQIEDNGFQNLPAVFLLLAPFLRSCPSHIRPDLIELLGKLALCSPNETAYTLRAALGSADNPDAAWIIRQVLPRFPDDIKVYLRQAMKDAAIKG